MGLDMSKVKQSQADLNERTAKGDGILVFCSKMEQDKEIDFRVAPPVGELNGIHYLEERGWWIDGEFFPTAETFGGVDVIKEEVDEALATKDPDLKELINAKGKDGQAKLSFKPQFLVPGWFLECEFDNDNKLTDARVEDDKCKILVSNVTLLKALNREITSRFAGSDPTDRVKGFNFILTKTGQKLNTEYNARIWNEPMPMLKEYFEEDKIINVYKYAQDRCPSDEYLRGIIRNYLYGEPKPKKEKKETEKEEKPKANTTSRSSKVEAKKEEKPTTVRGRNTTATSEKEVKKEEGPKKKGRSLMDALDEQ